MSGLLTKRGWFTGAAMIAVFAVAGCGDDEDAVDNGAGKGGGGSGGKAGAPSAGDAGEHPGAGTMNGGKGGNGGNAGKGGMAGTSTDGGMAGEDTGMAGEGGTAGGGGAGGEGGATSIEEQIRDAFEGMSPLPAVPADSTNSFADSANAATLGQKFFFDEKFSGALKATHDGINDLGTVGDTQKVACSTCHSGTALDDEQSNPATVALGAGVHTRNSPAVVNSSYYTWTNWGGRFAAQWELPTAVVESGVIMNGNRLGVAHRVFDVYKTEYEALFGALTPEIGTDAGRFPPAGKPKAAAADPDGIWELMAAGDRTIVTRILVNYGKSLQAYMRKLVSKDSPFDDFMAGDNSAMTAAQKRGALVFVDTGCMECHSGKTFSDQTFHDLGIPQTGLNNIPLTDDGHWKDATTLVGAGISVATDWSDDKVAGTAKLATLTQPSPEAWKGTFRTPSLRGVALTAPYMHSGQLATLSDVIDFYAAGGNADTAAGEIGSFTISAGEKSDLIAFLGALTYEAVPANLVVDTAP